MIVLLAVAFRYAAMLFVVIHSNVNCQYLLVQEISSLW
jgi:hypothetical protein